MIGTLKVVISAQISCLSFIIIIASFVAWCSHVGFQVRTCVHDADSNHGTVSLLWESKHVSFDKAIDCAILQSQYVLQTSAYICTYPCSLMLLRTDVAQAV